MRLFLEHKQGKLSYDALVAATRVGTLMQRCPQSSWPSY